MIWMREIRKRSEIYSNLFSDLTAYPACDILQALGELAERSIAAGCKPVLKGTVVRIHHSSPRVHWCVFMLGIPLQTVA